MSGPIPKDGVLDMPAYVGGREAVDGVDNPFKLSANENPLGASPKALAALENPGDWDVSSSCSSTLRIDSTGVHLASGMTRLLRHRDTRRLE